MKPAFCKTCEKKILKRIAYLKTLPHDNDRMLIIQQLYFLIGWSAQYDDGEWTVIKPKQTVAYRCY